MRSVRLLWRKPAGPTGTSVRVAKATSWAGLWPEAQALSVPCLQLAQATGATLTSKEARWILGRKPAEAERIKKVGIDAWQLLKE